MLQETINSFPRVWDGRKVVLISIVGSHNYGLADKNSDIDLKVGYLPTFDDLFANKFPTANIIGNKIDYTVSPIHHLVNHALKGNINFMEPWITSNRFIVSDLECVSTMLNAAFRWNTTRFFLATRGMAIQKSKRLQQYSEQTLVYKKEFGYNIKEAAHSVRCLLMLLTFNATNKISLSNFLNKKLVEDIKKGIFDKPTIEILIEKLLNIVNTFEPWFKEQDKTHYSTWDTNTYMINLRIKELIKESL